MIQDINDLGLERMHYPHLVGLPVVLPVTEATADADTFVCEFTAASGNETGVGGGLTGADLVLTAFGTPGSASGGYRTLDGHVDGFIATATAFATLCQGTEGTVALLAKNLAQDNSYNIIAAPHFECIMWTGGKISFYSNPEAGEVSANYRVIPKTAASATVATWLVWTWKNGLGCFMLTESATLPTSYADVPVDNRILVTSVKVNSSWGNREIVGRSTSSASANFDIGRVILSKKALALPVL